jgi:hypothetical protein
VWSRQSRLSFLVPAFQSRLEFEERVGVVVKDAVPGDNFTLKATGGVSVEQAITFIIPVISLWDPSGQPMTTFVSGHFSPLPAFKSQLELEEGVGVVVKDAVPGENFTLKATGGVSVEQAVKFIVPVSEEGVGVVVKDAMPGDNFTVKATGGVSVNQGPSML